MGITFRSTFNAKRIGEAIIQKLEKKLETAMAEAVTQIDTRTASGRKIDGGSFEKYSDAYAEFKTKAGRNARPDLTFTGQMLAAMQSKVERIATGFLGRIFFQGGRTGSTASNDQIAGYNQKTRPFFGLSDTQKKQILKKLQK